MPPFLRHPRRRCHHHPPHRPRQGNPPQVSPHASLWPVAAQAPAGRCFLLLLLLCVKGCLMLLGGKMSYLTIVDGP